jgi:PIN domain
MDHALETLRRLEIDGGNCESAHSEFRRAQKAYLDWVDDADGQLRSLFVDPEPADGLVSRTYWEIQRLSDATPGAWQVLRRELKAQSERLQAMQRRLTDQKDFAERPGELVVVDTSALVQGEWFEHFNWPAELDLGPLVRLVVPIVVIEELDDLKDRERRQRVRDRARRVLRRFRELGLAREPAQIRDKVTIEIFVDDDWQRRMPNNDGEIIEQAKLLEALTGRPVRLVCVDAAMEVRGCRRGLTVTAMPMVDEQTALAAGQVERP